MLSDPFWKSLGLVFIAIAILQSGCKKSDGPVPKPPTIFDRASDDTQREEAEVVADVVRESAPDGKPWISADSIPWEANYAQYLAGNRIGFSVVRVDLPSSKSAVPNPTVSQIQVLRSDFFETQVEGQSVTVQVKLDSMERSNGELRRFTRTTQIGSKKTVLYASRVDQPNRMSLRTEEFTDASGKPTSTVQEYTTFPENGWGVLGIQALLMRQPMVAGEKRVSKVFDLGLNEFVAVQLVAGQPEPTPVFGGATPELLPIEVTMQTDTSGMQTTNWVDERGEILKTMSHSQPSIITFRVDRATTERFESEMQFKEYMGKTIEFVGEVGESSQFDRAAYLVTAEGLDPFGLLSKSEYQDVLSVDDPRTVKVVIARKPEFTTPTETTNAMPSSADAEASTLVPSNHIVIATLAGEICAALTEPVVIAEKLTQEVAARVQLVELSPRISSALETARNLEGDINGKAVLLVALLRNKGIQARLASGLRMDNANGSQAVFHAWVEAFVDGHWRTLDPKDGGINDINKIRLHTSSLAEANPFMVVLPTLERLQSIKRVQTTNSD
jgi:hypothetical protein